jgi:hypothetical protein
MHTEATNLATKPVSESLQAFNSCLHVSTAHHVGARAMQAQGAAAEQRGPEKALQLQELAVPQIVRSFSHCRSDDDAAQLSVARLMEKSAQCFVTPPACYGFVRNPDCCRAELASLQTVPASTLDFVKILARFSPNFPE